MFYKRGAVWVWVAIIIAVLLLAASFFLSQKTSTSTSSAGSNQNSSSSMLLVTSTSTSAEVLTPPINTTSYICDGGKTFIAQVEIKPREPGRAELFFPNSSRLILDQTISGSGVRYANQDESLVFWTKGETAFIETGSTTPYVNCAAK